MLLVLFLLSNVSPEAVNALIGTWAKLQSIEPRY